MDISILDCGLGNFGSVQRMVEKVGGVARRITKKEEILNSKKIILPGVGSFDRGMSLLEDLDLVTALRAFSNAPDAKLLGICLGMQLLFDESEEGVKAGLGLIPGKVLKLSPSDNKLRVPHMGWNEVDVCKANKLIPYCHDIKLKPRFYFVHSYHVVCKNIENLIATADYGGKVAAVVSSENVFGVQFHPEKSHRFGVDLIANFVRL
jgi:glutamine amidotransferase